MKGAGLACYLCKALNWKVVRVNGMQMHGESIQYRHLVERLTKHKRFVQAMGEEMVSAVKAAAGSG